MNKYESAYFYFIYFLFLILKKIHKIVAHLQLESAKVVKKHIIQKKHYIIQKAHIIQKKQKKQKKQMHAVNAFCFELLRLHFKQSFTTTAQSRDF